jgi:F-type H+-transporting ATPase subunit b
MSEQKSDELISDARTKANKIVIKAEAEAKLVAEEIKAKALAESDEALAKSRTQIENERKQMIGRLKKETADLAIMATEKIIREKLDQKKDKALIESYLNRLEDETES